MTVYSDGDCNYSVEVSAPEACPQQCPLARHELCAGRGICAFDADLGASRCLCDEGAYGDDCAAEPPAAPTCDGVCVALGFVLVLLVCLIAAAAMIVWRLHGLSKREVVIVEARTGLLDSAVASFGQRI
jgi:hypothetical protein